MSGLLLLTAAAHAADAPGVRAKAARENNLGVAYMNQQLTQKAVDQFSAAYLTDPTLVTAVLNKGIALLYLNKMPEAEQAFEEAAAKDPKNPAVWYCLGLAAHAQGKSSESAERFERVVQMVPSNPDAHYFLGSSYLEMKEFEKAITEFQSALALNPLHTSSEFGLARAMQRSGKPDEARTHFQRFEHLSRDKISAPITHTYGEEGRYAKAADVFTPEPKVLAMNPITFVAQPVGATAKAQQKTGGVCFLDVDGDGVADFVLPSSGEQAIRVFRNNGSGKFSELASKELGLAVSGSGVACAVGDFDNDGLPDLAVALSDRVLLYRNEGHGHFTDVTKQAGIEPRNQPAGLTFVDYDHDGDLDLFVTGKPGVGADGKPASGPNVLWRNNGNKTFTDWTEQSGLAGEGETTGAVLSDINNDRAVDLVVAGSTKSPVVFFNPREGKFKGTPVYDDAGLAPTVGVSVLDFNKDGWMDIAVTHAGAPGVSLWRNVDGKRFERVPLPIKDAQRGWGLTAIDVDNDGWLDLAVVVETAKGSELRVFRNRGPEGFEDVSKSLGLDKIQLHEARSVVAADVDGDGDADLLVTQLNGEPLLLQNNGGNKNHSLKLALKGGADNKTGTGTEVEIFADGLWQKWEMAGAAGYMSQGPAELIAGLGSSDRADIVRLLWPTGVPQDELDVAITKPVSFTELDRRGSSCPVLFAWDGTRYQFVTDVIGAAVVGHWISPVAKNIADPDEWVKIDGKLLQARNGNMSVRFAEPMEEVNYIDQVRMVAVDHRIGTEVYPNEGFLNEPPFPTEKTIVSAAAKPPAGAWDDSGRDVLDLLRTRDHRYVVDFKLLNYAGYASMHTLTLDLGDWSEKNPLRLLAHGFIEYFSASSMYAAWQAGLDPIAPYVEAQMPDGSWKRVMDEMGFPAGLPRTIVADLTGKLPAGTRRIRIKTNLQIYWDQILVDNGPDISRHIRQTEMPLSLGKVQFHGYPQQIDGATHGDLTYNYENVSATGPFVKQRGSYTHYGDVTQLLKKVDDRYVVFGSGEEIDAEFSTDALPPLPAGWTRDYFFYANGFVKDMDFYEASPFTVADMPFHRMSRYPYPANEHFPQDTEALQYRLDWNDRFESGRTPNGFQLHYVPMSSEPPTLPVPVSGGR
ncbi:MAG TPA: FG-GAP-like repeat-containing protein [Acidisarcina sp.]|nr:FG-GAP-like repeat-containing protein [Acidisarcina sp.]